MRIAYLVMTHGNFRQVRWIINAIYNNEDLFILHIDKNADYSFHRQINEYLGKRPNVTYLPRRHVNRFGWSLVETELHAIRALISRQDEWDYLINVSGQDYPIKSTAEIKSKLAAEWPRNFVEVIPFSKMAELDPHDPHLARRLAFEMFGKVIKSRIRLPFPNMLNVRYKGSAWFMLTCDFCKWLVSDPITKKIATSVKYTWIPEELFFQVLIMNSPYRDLRAEHYGREIIWPGGTVSPKTLRMEDYERLSASPGLFARKFDELVDREVLVSLARDYGYEAPAY
jgi:hypothetical protein